MAEVPVFFLIAGEASGDLLGARLMQALKQATRGQVRFRGIGGPRMQAEGIELFFDQTELAHFGLFELLRHVPHLLQRIKQTIAEVKRSKPTALITIDAPDFCFRVAKQLKSEGIPLIHYVAPTVWVWRAARAKKIAQFLDHLLALLPFEPPYFTKEGLGCTFTGHPIVESGADKGDGARFRAKHRLAATTPLIAVLPGSRMSEVSRLLPIFGETLRQLLPQHPGLTAILPAVPHLRAYIERQVKDWPLPVIFTDNDTDKYDALNACRAALACSGTVAIELAMARLPAVITYKISRLTELMYRRFLKTKYASLVNIMHNAEVVPEALQHNCTPDKLAVILEELMSDEVIRAKQIAGLSDVAAWLGQGQFVPSAKAAATVLSVVGGQKS